MHILRRARPAHLLRQEEAGAQVGTSRPDVDVLGAGGAVGTSPRVAIPVTSRASTQSVALPVITLAAAAGQETGGLCRRTDGTNPPQD